MNILYGDFESYYDSKFSVAKMPTELYIRDPRFEVIGFAYSYKGLSGWLVGWNDINEFLSTIDWSNTQFVAHNARFDCLILAHIFKRYPAMVSCTMSMASAAGLASVGRVTLDNVGATLRAAGYSGIPEKGKTVSLAAGQHLNDMDLEFLREYGEYARTDVDICRRLYEVFSKVLPPAEIMWQSMVLKSGYEPRMHMNLDVLKAERDRIEIDQENSLLKVAEYLNVTGNIAHRLSSVQSALRSKDKLYTVLDKIGGCINPKYWSEYADDATSIGWRHTGLSLEEYCNAKQNNAKFAIPMKVSEPKTKKNGYITLEVACAKTDEEFTKLADSSDPIVSAVANARLMSASSIALTRCDRFIELAKLGVCSVPINISGAHTHRMSGADKLNVQNLPSGRKAGQTKALRKAMEAPDGWVYVAADASQIEARLNAYESQELALLEIFASGGDPYSVMAGHIYGIDSEQIRLGNKAGDATAKLQRQAGKASTLGAGYRMGANRFLDAAREQYGLSLTYEEAVHIIRTYRATNINIVNMWKFLDNLLMLLMQPGQQGYFGGKNNDLFYYNSDYTLFGKRTPGIMLPDGLWVIYPELRCITVPDEYTGRYKQQPVCKRYSKGKPKAQFLHGGVVLENITQALAFCIGKWQSSIVGQRYPFVMNEHDAWVFMAPENEAEAAKNLLVSALKQNPPWLDAQCVLGCEAGYHKSYGLIEK